MPSTSHNISGTKVISSDWSNFRASLNRWQDKYDWNGVQLHSLYSQIENHPAKHLVSINFLFSYFKQQNISAYPNEDIAICSINAAADLLQKLNELLNYIPSDLE